MSEESSSAIPKWQIGLAVGVPIAVACAGAFLYYRWSRKASSTDGRDRQQGNDEPTVENVEPQSGSRGATESKEAKGKEYSSHTEEESRPYKSPTERARESKDKGNKLFRDGHYTEAIECYTDSIQLTPRTERSDLAVYHHNRAACYDKLV
jgi:import receptor subunit TOM70